VIAAGCTIAADIRLLPKRDHSQGLAEAEARNVNVFSVQQPFSEGKQAIIGNAAHNAPPIQRRRCPGHRRELIQIRQAATITGRYGH